MGVAVSVIVPVYKVEKYLKRCVESIQEQSLTNIEIILINDGSPDNCPIICDELAKNDNRIQVIHQNNAGLGMARNAGLKVASGKYVAFVDSDDFLPMNALEVLYNAAVSNAADTVLGGYFRKCADTMIKCPLPMNNVCFEGRDNIIDNVLVNMLGSPMEYYDDILLKRAVWASLYSRKIIEDNELKFCSEREFISEDIIFDLDYYPCSKKVMLIDDLVYYYCVNSDSLTLSYNPNRYNKQVVLFEEIVRRAEELDMDISERVNRSFIGNARQCIYSDVRHLTLREALKDIREICFDSNLVNALAQCAPTGSSIKQKMFMALMKKKRIFAIYFICKIFK